MDQDKPFKTIEVVDFRTNQICKVACMSCIRGHRTTSCGIPVCRTKIFWTVKRPGRPSNSCTCRYGATGGCKCVVARSACPHKSKKGEKRSGECRCEEQGRYCCLLEPDHWNSLIQLQKPTVDFHATREDLEAKQAAAAQTVLPHTPAYSSVTSLQSTNSKPSTPAPQGRIQPVHILPNTYSNGYPSISSPVTARFGLMGIGAPMGSQHDLDPDVLMWEGQAPTAPIEFNHPHMFETVQSERGACCQASTPSALGMQSPPQQALQNISLSQAFDEPYDSMSMPPPIAPAPVAFDFDRLQQDYFNHQFPSAICQNCGLSGCTCRNCPPVFQNYGTTSWAHCCGRKHARDVQPTPVPVPQKYSRTEHHDASQGIRGHPPPAQSLPPEAFMQPSPLRLSGNHFVEGYQEAELPPPGVPPDFESFDLDHDFLLPDGTAPLDINEFLLSDLDQSVQDSGGSGSGDGGGGGGGGCCCGDP